MTAIYDHLGNYIGDDGNPEFPTTSIDQMRYELSMMPLRPGGSDVPYTTQELRSMPQPAPQPEPPRPYSTATNVAQAVADRLGLSAIPQAALGMISGFPAAVAKELGYPQVAEKMQYTPTSRAGADILEAAAAAPQAITGSHMGFGPLAEYWVPKSGFGLQSRPVITPSDVQVLGGRAIARGREVAAIPEDFRAAQAGLQRESDLGGPTYGARLQDITEGLGDYLARQEAMRYSYEPTGSVQVFGNMVPETNLYAVRPSGTANQVFREVPTALNPRFNVTGESRLTGDLAEILDREEPTKNIEVGTRVQPFTNFVPNNFDKSANDLFREFIVPKMAEEFPGLQNDDLLRAAQIKYGTGLQDWMKGKLEEFSQLPEVKAYNKAAIDTIENDYTIDNPTDTLRDVLIVPPSVKLAGAQAAENWVMQNLQNYFAEYVGTEADPVLQEVAKTGKTIVPLDELQHFSDTNRNTAQSNRRRAGMPIGGTMKPKLTNSIIEEGEVNQRLEQIQTEFNALVAANPGVRPADIPGIKELYKEQRTLTKVKDKLVEQTENLRKAMLYEDYIDANVRPMSEKAMVEEINPSELQRFPMVPTNKELMYQAYVPKAFAELGKEIVNKLEAGLLTPEAAKNLSVPTAARMKAEMMIKKDQLAKEAAKLDTELLKSYIIQETQTLPQDGKYGKGVVVKFDDSLTEAQMERALSSECEFMDHCIGRGGTPDDRVLSRKARALGPSNVGSDDKYAGYIPMIAAHRPGRVVPKGSSGTATSYMTEFLQGKSEGRSFRDDATGVPFATMKLYRDDNGMYRMGEFYGYKDRAVDGPWYEGREGGYTLDEKREYRQVIADWANDHSDQLKPVRNDHLYQHAKVYDAKSDEHKGVLAHVLGIRENELGPIVEYVGKRFITEDEAKAAKTAIKEAPTSEIEALRETRNDVERALRNGNFMDDEEEAVLRGQLADLNDEIRALEQRGRELITPPAQMPQVQGYMSWLNNRYPNVQDRINQIDRDLNDITAGVVQASQHGLENMLQTSAFINALSNERHRLSVEQSYDALRVEDMNDADLQRLQDNIVENLIRQYPEPGQIQALIEQLNQGNYDQLPMIVRQRMNERQADFFVSNITSDLQQYYDNMQAPQLTAPAAQTYDLDTELFGAVNSMRENYDDTIGQIAEGVINDVTTRVGSINDNPQQWIDTLRQDMQNYANRTRQALEDVLEMMEGAYNSRQPAEQINEQTRALANDIVPANAAFRNQAVEDIGIAIRDQLMPTITEYNPTIPRDREALQRELTVYQTQPLDRDLGGRLEEYIQNNTARENDIRERIADFMINEIETRLGNRVAAPQLPAVPERAGAENVAPLVRDALNALPTLRNNAFVTEIVAQQVVDLSGQVSFGQRPDDFVQQLRDRAQMLEEAPPTRETNPDDRAEAARQMRLLANNLSAREVPQLPTPDFLNHPSIASYRDQYTNEDTGSRRAFNEVMIAEHIRPGAINEAIHRTDDDARYNQAVMDFYRVNSPAGIGQLNNALRQYMEGNGFEIEETFAIDDGRLDEIASNYINSLGDLTPEILRQEAEDMHNGMIDLPELQDLPDNDREEVLSELAYRLNQQADMMEEAEAGTLASQFTARMSRDEVRNRIGQILADDRYEEAELRELQRAINDRDNVAFNLRGRDFTDELSELFDYRLGTWEPAEAPQQAATPDLNQVLFDSLMSIRNDLGGAVHQRALEITNEASNDTDLTEQPREYIHRLRITADAYTNQMNTALHRLADDLENAYIINARPQTIEVGAEPATRYADVMSAYHGIMFDNDQFSTPENLDALRALPQLIRRQGNTRNSLGIGNFSNDQARQLARVFEAMYETRRAEFQANGQLPEGHKDGGLIKMRKGGKTNVSLNTPELNEKLDKLKDSINKPHRWDNFDDGYYLLDRSNHLEVLPVPVFPRKPQEDILNQSHMSMERYDRPIQYYSSGGVNKVRPTPHVPAVPAKQNPNTTDYVPTKPVDKGFKETLERIRGRSSEDLPDNYRAGGSISIDEMKYALMKGR